MEILNDLTSIIWILIGITLLAIVYIQDPNFSLQTERSAPHIPTSFQIFGTFLGITFSLKPYQVL